MAYIKAAPVREDAAAVRQPGRMKRGSPLLPAGRFAALLSGGGVAKGQAASFEGAVPQGPPGMAPGSVTATLAKVLENSATPLQTLHTAGTLLNGGPNLAPLHRQQRISIDRTARLAAAEAGVRVGAHRKIDRFAAGVPDMPGGKGAVSESRFPAFAGKADAGQGQAGAGALSARFESGSEGIAAIGYDRHGGTSYGKYQMSSRAGTMQGFIQFLKTEAPEWADRLEKAGPANTGGRTGAMPDLWKELAGENPGRFEDVQERFIAASHFQPTLAAIAQQTGVAFHSLPQALREVVFSTAVQHGPTGAARIVGMAVEETGQRALDPAKAQPAQLRKSGENLIRRIYDLRSGQFASSAPEVQTSVKSRLRQEMGMALSMLRDGAGPLPSQG